MRSRILVLMLALFAALAAQPAIARDTGGWSTLDVDGVKARIYRDEWGIPHIFAPTNDALFEAYGYSVAEDRLWQLEIHRRAARGTLSEVFGPSFIEADQVARRDGYTDAELDTMIARSSAEEREISQAYIDGINRYIRDVVQVDPANKLPYEFQLLGFQPSLWTMRDSAAFGAFAVRQFGEIGGSELRNQQTLDDLVAIHGLEQGLAILDDVKWVNDPSSPTTVPGQSAAQPAQTSVSLPALQAQLKALGTDVSGSGIEEAKRLWSSLQIVTKLGSYAWAISPNKSSEHAAMLYGGPQMGFDTPPVIHEVQLVGGDGFNVMGMAFAGVPPVLIGRNENIAWTSTTATGDNVDTYVETLCGPTSYMYNGVCTAMEVRTEDIEARSTGMGVPLETEANPYDIYRTVHGPVIAFDYAKGVAFSQKRAHWMRELESTRPFLMFDRADNVADFDAAARLIVTSHNFMYADREGNIAYWQTGQVPLRPAGFDQRLPLPGTGEAEWPGGIKPMPKVVNPAQGWLANWNNKPVAWYDDPDGRRFGLQDRVLDVQQRLSGPQLISLADMFDIPKDIGRIETLGRDSRFLLPYLFRALDAVPSSHPLVPQANGVLRGWNENIVTDVIAGKQYELGYIIFWVWQDKLAHNMLGDELGPQIGLADANVLVNALGGNPAMPPSRDYLNGADANALIVRSLEEALSSLSSFYQTDDMSKWQVTRDDIVFVHPLGIELGRVPLSNRSTYAQVIVLKDFGVSGYNIIPLGQSGFIDANGTPGPHVTDQLPLYRNFEYKRMHFYFGRRLIE